MKRILFSPIGSTDPISGEHDGALLHIIRTYRPEKVIIYLSKEICELEEKDGRYSYCLNQIKEYLDIDFEVIWEKREDLVDVHIFDFFLNEFKSILDDIYEEDAEIYLNVSSGTPAMKSSLQILASLYTKPLIPIQVSTPAKSINDREDVKGEYMPELQWECNQDNCDDYNNRCTVSEVFNLTNAIRKNMIKELVDSYDYVAALRLAEPIEEYLNSDAVSIIRAGAARLQLDKSECQKSAGNYDIFPKKSGDEWRIFEYLMLLDVKLKKKEYADFIRAISPLFFEILQRIVMNIPSFDYNYYTYEDKLHGNSIKWKKSNCDRNSNIFGSSLIQIDWDRFVTTADLDKIIDMLSADTKLKKLTHKLRLVEEKVRNYAAHTIMGVTEDRIKERTKPDRNDGITYDKKEANGFSSKDIFDMLVELIRASGIKITAEDLKTYDKLNDEIKERLG